MSEVTDKLLEIRKQALAENGAATEPKVEGSVTETQPEAEVEVAVEPPSEVEQTNVTPEAEPETVEAGWDDSTEGETTSSQEIDLSWVSDLELGEVKTLDDVKAKVKELKSSLKEYADKPLAGIPEEFREVVEVAKTGDWKELLASQMIDYTKVHPLDEFENEYYKRAQKNPRFFTDGKFDEDKVREAIDAIPEVSRELEGERILQDKMELQARHKEKVIAQAQARKAEAEKTLAQATKNLGELLPLDIYGIKFEPKHSTEIYNGILSSKLTKKHLGMSYEDLVRTGADMKAVTRTVTMAEKGEKMIAYKASNSKVEAKKEVLNNIQNVQLNTSGTAVQPENPEAKVKAPHEKLAEFYASQKRGL